MDLATLPTLPTLLDGLLAAVALETLVLLWWHRRTGGGLAPSQLLPTLAAGAGVMLAWRFSAAGAPPLWAAGAMALAGTAHAVDLGRRWRVSRRSASRSAAAARA
jgi:hypothetical protein